MFGIGASPHLAGYIGRQMRREGRQCAVLDQCGIALADQLLALAPGRGEAGLLLAWGTPYGEVEAAAAQMRMSGGSLVLVTDSAEMIQALETDAVINVPRGLPDRISLHGATMACLDMLILGLAALEKSAAVDSIERLRDLRASVIRPVGRRGRRKQADRGDGTS